IIASNQQYDPLLIAVCAHSARWENVRVRFYIKSAFRALSAMVKSNVSALRRLCLGQMNGVEEQIDAFQVAPQLHEFTFFGNTNSLASKLKLPFPQITSYHGFASQIQPELSNNYDFLKTMPRLESLYLSRKFALYVGGTNDIPLAFLHTLSIDAKEGSILTTSLK
ncbi:hypothetical protein MPER_02072, partial [Moniliophthora perniciosa FA553]